MYSTVIFIIVTLNLSTIGQLTTEYMLPNIENISTVSIEVGDHFYLSLAFSFLLFSVLVTPTIVFYKYKSHLLITIFLAIIIPVILWTFVNIFVEFLFSSQKENIMGLYLYPFYTKASIIIGILTFIIVFFVSYLRKAEK